MKSSSQVWSKSNIVNWLSDTRNSVQFYPFPTVFAVLVDEHFASGSSLIASNSNHWRVCSGKAGIPREAAQGQFALDFMLQCPLAQIHNIRGFVDSNNTLNKSLTLHLNFM